MMVARRWMCLVRLAYERYREAHGLDLEIAEESIPGIISVTVGEALKEKYGDTLLDKGEQYWLGEIRDFATEAMMALIREDLAALGVTMDVYFSEKSLYGTGRIEAALKVLEEKARLMWEQWN